MTAGTTTARSGDRWWAWAASRVMPAQAAGTSTDSPDVPTGAASTVHNVFSGTANTVMQAGEVRGDVHLHGQDGPVPDDSAWLRSAWDVTEAARATMEIRYLTRPGDTAVKAYLITRAEAADREEARHRVAAVRADLDVLPAHVTAVPVPTETETRHVLAPFRATDIVEIRKRVTARRTTRDDAHHPWLTAIIPLHGPHPWEPLWSALAALPCHAMLSVGLAPYRVGAGLHTHLAARAADLGRLARQGPPPTSVWRVPRPPDEFAAAALPLVTDAVRRYTDRAFVVRVSVAADRPVPGVFAELAAGTISARTAAGGLAGAGPAVVRPSPAELPTAWHNLTALNFAPLTAYDQDCPPEALGPLERTLSAIADPAEAAAAFRLPYRRAGQASPI